MGFSSSSAQSVMSRFFNNLWKKCAPYSSDHRRKPTDTDRDEAKWAFPEELCRRFSLAEIKAATQNFNARLQIGSTRTFHGLTGVFEPIEVPITEDGINVSARGIYKGYTNLNGVNSTVAIKRIPSTRGREFKAEVQLLCQLRHPNVISLIGFCQDKVGYAIVYDYTSNGSLSDSLVNPCNDNKSPLSWKQRLNICIGVARAIHYLHAGVKHAVIHRDVKCDNILLDQHLEAKLSNFRLSKMGPPSLSNSLIRLNSDSQVSGTVGYLDPEYLLSRQFTEKSDVFSFGVVLYEVLSADLRGTPRGCMDCPANILDPFLMGKIAPDCLIKFLDIIQRCVHPRGAQRPTMGEVEVELELALELQERADAEKELRRTSTPLYQPADCAYGYEGISVSGLNENLSSLYMSRLCPVSVSELKENLSSLYMSRLRPGYEGISVSELCPGYEGISDSEFNETFSSPFMRRHSPVVSPTRSADFSVLSDDDGSSEFEFSGR